MDVQIDQTGQQQLLIRESREAARGRVPSGDGLRRFGVDGGDVAVLGHLDQRARPCLHHVGRRRVQHGAADGEGGAHGATRQELP